MKLSKFEIDISEEEKELLNEVANIGLGKSASSLSALLGRKVEINKPEIAIIRKKDIYNVFSREEIYAGIHLRVLEDIDGLVVCLFKELEAIKLLSGVSNQKESLTDEKGINTLKEISSILIGSYLTSLGDFSGMKLVPSLPHLSVDTSASILDFLTSNFGYKDFEFLLIRNKLEIKDLNIKVEGSLVFILTPEDIKKMIYLINQKYSNNK